MSSKYQIVIPLSIRKEFDIKPGQKVFFVKTENGIQIITQIPLSELFGKLKGMNSIFVREEDRI